MSDSLTRFAKLSIAAAIATISLKTGAYLLTGSVGLLSDALESIVNLVAAVSALFLLKLAEKPPDRDHAYGHTKAEYFSSVFEGILIVIAAAGIFATAIDRIMHPRPMEQIGIGIIVAAIASVINLIVALRLISVGKKNRSVAVEADGHHLLTDVWTSVGVIVAVGLVSITGIQLLDPIIAMLVALNIIITGFSIVKRSTQGLMDTAFDDADLKAVEDILAKHCTRGVSYHGLRTRQSAARRFMSVHILVPGAWTIQKGHNLSEKIEKEIAGKFPRMTVTTHLEPAEDPKSQDDIAIDRTI